MRFIRWRPNAATAAVATAKATGAAQATGCPIASPANQGRIDVGSRAATPSPRMPPRTGSRANTTNPTAMTAGWPGTIVPAASPTPAKNATRAIIPAANPATATTGGMPYRTATTATVATSGSTTALTASIALDEAHFASQIAVRETGFEATQASVPDCRSATIRLPTAKIAARTKICAPTAVSRLSIGTREAGAGASAPSGSEAMMRLVIQQIGRAACRERVQIELVGESVSTQQENE